MKRTSFFITTFKKLPIIIKGALQKKSRACRFMLPALLLPACLFTSSCKTCNCPAYSFKKENTREYMPMKDVNNFTSPTFFCEPSADRKSI